MLNRTHAYFKESIWKRGLSTAGGRALLDFGGTLHCCNSSGLRGCSSGGSTPVDNLGDPYICVRLEPDAVGHPTLLPESKRDFGRVCSWGGEDTCWRLTLVGFD
jgi:hypothetical protein